MGSIKRGTVLRGALACVVVLAGVLAAVALAADPFSYDQLGPGSTTSAPSNIYDAGSAISEDRAADDFMIPAGRTVQLTSVEAIGTDSYNDDSSPALGGGFVFSIYPDAGGHPALDPDNGPGPLYRSPILHPKFCQASDPIGQCNEVERSPGGGTYKLLVNLPAPGGELPAPPPLPGGKLYWLVVQQDQAYFHCPDNCVISRWEWDAIPPDPTGSPPVVQTPFQGCEPPDWHPLNCGIQLRSKTRASTRASLGPGLRFAVTGTSSANATGGGSCGAVSAAAKYFSPRVKKFPFEDGVRARVTASAPSDVTVTAKLRERNGKVTGLGTFTKIVTTFKKLRMPLVSSLAHLRHGDKVTLLLHIVTRPRGVSTCEPDVRDVTIKTRVIYIQSALADKPIG